MPHDMDDDTSRLLKSIVDQFRGENRDVRERQIRNWKRLKLYWNNFSRIYWSETARDYRISDIQDSTSQDSDQAYYDRPINVFRAFLETIIAAMSIQIPGINCVPDDAENPLDLSTAKAGNKIAELIGKHNDVVFLWLHSLYVFLTEGMVACHSYIKEDKEYGTYEEKQYKDEEVESYVCPSCQNRLADSEFDPKFDQDDIGFEDQSIKCPECGDQIDRGLQKTKLIVPRFIGNVTKPKARVMLDCYGGLYVDVANYARKQKDTPYLILSYETHYSNALARLET